MSGSGSRPAGGCPSKTEERRFRSRGLYRDAADRVGGLASFHGPDLLRLRSKREGVVSRGTLTSSGSLGDFVALSVMAASARAGSTVENPARRGVWYLPDMSLGHSSRGATIGVLLAILAAFAPGFDMVLFGPHEHVAEARAFEAQPAPADPIDPPGPHHCELSASPAERSGAPVVAALRPLAWIVSDPLASTPHATPFVPLTPPRT